jgi:sirohydrochlorin cobaltochelatase
MVEARTGTLLIVPGPAGEDWEQLAANLAGRLDQVVQYVAGGQSFVAGVRSLVASGVQRLVVLPLLPPDTQEAQGVARAVEQASRRWPFLTFHRAVPLTWQEWAALVREVAQGALAEPGPRPAETALLIVAAGSADALANADLARLAYLVWEGSEFARVDCAFLETARPNVADAVGLLARINPRAIAVVPWLLPAGDRLRLFGEQAGQRWDLPVVLAPTPLAQSAFLDLILSHCQAALDDESLLAPSWEEVLAEVARATGHAMPPQEEAQLRELDRKINEMLPPQYQGRYDEVAPTSMGSAGLRYGPDGQVAWDEMWTSFCDLALAGGPAHRGTLLEAVTAGDALAELDKYQAVVAQIERGIKLVTGLPVVPSRTAGWVGVRCDSEEMALWLMRAIIVENVMVRREGDVLYLPAGPRFTLQREIKNVITVIAKTCHYWTAHLAGRRLSFDPGAPPCTSSGNSSSKS